MTKITFAYQQITDHQTYDDDKVESKLVATLPDGTKIEEQVWTEQGLYEAVALVAGQVKVTLERAGEDMGELIIASVPPSKVSVLNMEVKPPESYTHEICAVPDKAWRLFRVSLILAMQGLLD